MPFKREASERVNGFERPKTFFNYSPIFVGKITPQKVYVYGDPSGNPIPLFAFEKAGLGRVGSRSRVAQTAKGE